MIIVQVGVSTASLACLIAGVALYVRGHRRALPVVGVSGVLGAIGFALAVVNRLPLTDLAVGAALGAVMGAVAFRVATYLRDRRERDL